MSPQDETRKEKRCEDKAQEGRRKRRGLPCNDTTGDESPTPEHRRQSQLEVEEASEAGNDGLEQVWRWCCVKSTTMKSPPEVLRVTA